MPHTFAFSAAVTVDGYLAGPNDDLSFLSKFSGGSYGLEEFMASIDSIVMGAATYRFVLEHASAWPYGERRTWIVTHDADIRMIDGANMETFAGDVTQLAELVRTSGVEKTWLVGGGNLLRQFIDARLMDELELTTMPVLLGDGAPTFPIGAFANTYLELREATTHDKGVVTLRYGFADA